MSGKFKHALKATGMPLSGALALLASPAAGQSATEDSGSANGIIVTAQKREERLLDVPVPVTAVSSADLLAQNQTKAQDFFASVPGVNLQFQNNAGTGNTIWRTTVKGNLQCQGNHDVTGGGNTVSGNRQGQCAAL